MIDRIDALERVKRPEYTGENRCLPCTVVNVVIAGLLAAGLAVLSPPLGVLAFGAFLLIIGLRGYLIPRTPTLTRRYLPDRVLRAFGKEPDRPTVEIADADLATVRNALTDAGVVHRREEAANEADRVQLSPGFRDRWNDRLARFTTETDREDEARDWRPPDAADVAAMFDADVDFCGDATVELDGSKRVRWESDAALAADVAADRELRTRLDGWAALDPDDRRDVLAGLRLLRERCPVPGCDGDLHVTAERLDHCCRRPRIGLESACEDCGRPLVTLAVPEGSYVLEWVPEGERREVVE